MSTGSIETFVDSLADVSTVNRTRAAEFSTALSSAIEPPAVGTQLPFDGVSLADTPVETGFTPAALETAETGVTPVRLAIATYGTVAIPSRPDADELVSLYTNRHVAILAASDLVETVPAAYDRLADEFNAGLDSQVLATGPSATADMGDLIEGVHGPHETHVVVLEDR